jgi:flagellar motor switch protein FliN/FliY
MAKDSQDNAMDQDKLAEEWAAALADQEEQEGGGTSAEESAEASAGEAGQDNASGSEAVDQDALAEEWAKAFADEEEQKMTQEKSSASKGTPREVEFEDLSNQAQAPPQGIKREMEFILDIPLDVSAELGRSKLLINDLLQLGQGSVIELDKLAGEPLEILVNGKLVARGEAVVINEKFGVRLTDIISPMERVQQLG